MTNVGAPKTRDGVHYRALFRDGTLGGVWAERDTARYMSNSHNPVALIRVIPRGAMVPRGPEPETSL